MPNITACTVDGQLRHFGTFTPSSPWALMFMRNMPKESQAEKTVIVVGMPHAGTSAAAAVLDAIGVPMGKQNDLRGGGAFENQSMMANDAELREATIRDFNARYSIWGWKNPRGASVMERLPEGVRNPHCVFVFRDPIALAYSRYLPLEKTKAKMDEVLQQCCDEIRTLMTCLLETPFPSLLVSYERIKTTPEFYIQALIEFLEITVTPGQWVEALGRVSSRGGYVTMPHEYGIGKGNLPSPEEAQNV